ncbi:MAG: lysylphosphatidylglycerol synthase transmembrane domain-containing protein [Chloroflexi bacterium]|nr:lysylphosphatidylglycerol synthase transmembrane domain-containing protein [Chloroflexota bacterium]
MPRDSGDNSPSVSLRQRVLSPYTLLSLVVAVAFLYFLAVRFDLDWEQTWSNIKGLDPVLYALGLLLYYLSFVFRGVRWRILSRSAGIEEIADARTPSVWRYSQLIVVGWFVNSVAWLRLGDAYRAYALSDEARTGFSWSLGTIFGERVMDMITVFVLIVVGALAFSVTADVSGTVYVVGAAFVMALALIGVLVVMRGYGQRWARFLPDRLESAYRRFHDGALGSFGQLRVPFLLSFVGWILEVGRLYFVVQALDFDVSLSLILIAALGHALLSTVPTPGGVGAVEPGVTGLLVLGMARHDAASVALVDRSITYLSIIVIGGLVFLAWNLTRSRRKSERVRAAEE